MAKLAVHQDRAKSRTREREREREIKHIATGTYPQPRRWTNPSLSWRASGWWRWPPVMDSPSDRVPGQGPDWFLVATEACGGGTPDLGYFLGVSVFIGIFGIGFTSGGSPGHPRGKGPCPGGWARPPPSWTAWDSSGPTLLLRELLLGHKKSSKIGTTIGLRLVFLFCKTQKQGKIETGTGL